MRLASRITPNRPPSSLLDYLAKRFTYHAREEWSRLIDQQRVRINGNTCASDALINGGDEVVYEPYDFVEPPCNLNFRIVYEDEWLLGVDKPGNLLVHRAGKSFRSNLIYQLREGVQGPAYPHAHIVSRLDRETSGIVLVAKNGEVLRAFHVLVRDGRIGKEYLAIARGLVDPSLRVIDKPIGPDRGSALPFKFAVDPTGGKPSVTEVLHVQHLGDSHSLLRLKLITGRTHQIRVHCASIGHPLLGDKLYGMSEEQYLARQKSDEWGTTGLDFPRQALHCARTRFVHPLTKAETVIEAPVPRDMEEFVGRTHPLPLF